MSPSSAFSLLGGDVLDDINPALPLRGSFKGTFKGLLYKGSIGL